MKPKSSKFISKKVGLVLAIIVIFLVVATGISLLVYFILRNKHKSKPKPKSKPKSVPVLPLEPINESCKCKDYNSDNMCVQENVCLKLNDDGICVEKGDRQFDPFFCLKYNDDKECNKQPLCVWN